MTRTDLLNELATLTHSARQRRMVEIGRLAASDPAARELLAELQRGVRPMATGLRRRCCRTVHLP